jgi:hypothetical protein
MSIAGLVALLALMTSSVWAQPNSDSLDTGTPADAAKAATGAGAMPADNRGPEKWDASGRVKCSVDSATFSRTCGFRVVRNRNEKSVTIWIRNLAKNKADYRVLRYADETFTSNDDSKVTWQRKGDNWLVRVDSKEFYRIPDRLTRAD